MPYFQQKNIKMSANIWVQYSKYYAYTSNKWQIFTIIPQPETFSLVEAKLKISLTFISL